MLLPTAELSRLEEQRTGKANWKRWGPYLSERAWGTVREDYSANGDAWNYFPHDHARSRAYRWSEDGIGGFSDEKQHLCLAVALWNERDPILKERMFGLANQQGNHGEDVKEYYFYLDGTPTHSYMKMLYKYPQVAYPYDELVQVNGQRTQADPEFELFDALQESFLANRYFDVTIEYAKANSEDILCRITVENRGPDLLRCTSCLTSGCATSGRGSRGRRARRSKKSPRTRCTATMLCWVSAGGTCAPRIESPSSFSLPRMRRTSSDCITRPIPLPMLKMASTMPW